MGFFSHDSDQAQAYDEYGNTPHKASVTHELLAGAAAFEAAKAYEKHVEANGQPANHAMAKELLAGFAGAFVDREVETHGLDFVDKQKAKHHAKVQAEEALAANYSDDY